MKHQANRSLSKTLAIVLAAFTWLVMSVQSICAQTPYSSVNPPRLSRVPDEIGPNYLRWHRDSDVKNGAASATGFGTQQPNVVESSMAKGMTDGSGVVQIESGLNYWDGRQWSPSDASFDLTDDAFVALRVQQKTRLSAQLNVVGAVTTKLRDGTVLSSTPVGIALYDPDDGRIAIVGVLTNSTGYLVASNQVVYPDAFAGGICANVVYTLERGSFAQDIVITGHFDPVEWGFPTNSQLKIMTEFYSAPTPQKLVRPLYVERNPAVRQRKVSPDLMDEMLTFGNLGEWMMGTGKAYTAATSSKTNGMEALVGKEFTTIQGRNMLIESVDCELLQDALKNLPLCADSSAAGSLPRGTSSDIYASIPSPRSKMETAVRPQRATAQFADADGAAGHGVVIDYVATLTGGTTVVLKHDTTYFVSGTVYCGSLVIEGGTVCKYAAGASIVANGVTCETSSYRPAVFTALDDESIGESMQGKTGWTGQIHTHYANPAIRLSYTSGTLSNLRFCYAQEAVRFEGVSYTTATLEHSQLINSILGVGIAGYDGSGSGSGSGGGSGVLFTINNCLLANLTSAVQHIVHGQSRDQAMLNNCTIDNAQNLLGSGSGSDYFSAYFTNCVFSKISGTSGQGAGLNGDYNGFYQTTMFIPGSQHYWTATSTPFHIAGGGDYYLDPANGANFLGKATTGIPSSLLAELQARTTQAPLVLGTINSPTSEPPTGIPDSGALDLGYHYPILDYVCSQTAVSADLTFEPGTSVGWTGTGIIPDSSVPNVQVVFDGTLVNRCYFMPCNTIQEQASEGPGFTGNNNQPSLKATFTYFWALDPATFFDANYSTVAADNCEFWKGTLGGTVGIAGGPNLTLKNCLLDTSSILFNTTANSGLCYLTMQNCTLHEGELFLRFNNSEWSVVVSDCAFDGTTIDSTAGSSALSDYNAYLTGVNPIKSGESHSFTVSSFNWQSGLLGGFYLPPGSPLIDYGSRSANDAGLRHYTTLNNQTPEGNSPVDIGFHYVALDPNGNPSITGVQGTPDYVLDSVLPSISITAPANNSSFNTARVNVTGTFAETYLKQITVNGVPAYLSGNTFEAMNVPLTTGANTITATAKDLVGNTGIATITVTGSATPVDPVQLQGTPIAGFASLNVTFQPSANVPGTLQQVLYDFNGDGISDQTASDLNPVSHTFSTAGQYFPAVTIVTTAGRFSSDGGWNSADPNRLRINVQSPPVQQSVISIANPVDLKCDPAGNLYVLSQSTATITEYNSSSAVIRSLSGIGTAPRGLDVDSAGNVFVAMTGANQVWKFVPTGTSFAADTSFGNGGHIGIDRAGSNDGQFNVPFDVAVSPDGQTIAVSDSGNNRIQQFNADGTFMDSFGSLGTDIGQFNAPKGLTYDDAGYLYIVDSGNNRVALAQSSIVIGTSGTSGTALGQFQGAVNLGVGSRGIYVGDAGNNRVQSFDPLATGAATPFTSRGSISTEMSLNQPNAVATVADFLQESIYIADTGNNRVILCNVPDGSLNAIQAVWNSMKTHVASGDIDGALSYFSIASVDQYRQAFLSVGTPNTITAISQIGTLTADSINGDSAEFYFTGTIDGQVITFPVDFDNENGVWKIMEF